MFIASVAACRDRRRPLVRERPGALCPIIASTSIDMKKVIPTVQAIERQEPLPSFCLRLRTMQKPRRKSAMSKTGMISSAAVRRGGRNGKCGCHRKSVGSCISNARCRWRNRCRGGCGSGFNWRLPFAREARDKCRTTCCSNREKQDGYSAYRCGGHGRQPVAKSLARQHPPEINGAPNRSRQSSPRTRIHAARETTPRKFGDFGGDAPGLVAGEQLGRRAPTGLFLEVENTPYLNLRPPRPDEVRCHKARQATSGAGATTPHHQHLRT